MASGTGASFSQFPGFDMNGNPIKTKPPVANVNSSNIPQPTINNQYPQSVIGANNDYSGLMKQYQDLYNSTTDPNNPTSRVASQFQDLYNTPTAPFQPVTPQTTSYNPTADTTSSIANLKDLAATGGYSAQGIADLRERGISPIRSVYASAQQGIDRAKRLQGGYSPNYTAATAKLTRGLSDAVSSGEQNVNAGIAQNVASNRLGIAPAYSSASANQQSDINNINTHNADVTNQANEFNSSGATQAAQFDAQAKQSQLQALAQLYTQSGSNKLAILDAMKSLYGTTPAQPALYGQQAATQTGLDLENKKINNDASTSLINSYRN